MATYQTLDVGNKSMIAQELLDATRNHAKSVMQAVEDIAGDIDYKDIKQLVDSLGSEQLEDLVEFINNQDSNDNMGWSFPKGVKLSFQNIFYRYSGDGEVYLSGVSGYVKPGEMLLMLGAPDSQMDTLLRVLAKRDLQGEVYGNIMLDGLLPGNDFKRKIAYVPKIEICIPTITVQETVYTSYRLRMAPETPEPAVILRVLLVLKIFGILRVRETIVGDPINIRGISGGERRRLSFCQEVGGFASLLMADLPTNGLDSATAYNLCKSCQTACKALDLSLIFCLAQPSPELAQLFDNLLLLSKGRQIYFGPVDKGMEYFSALGFQKPKLKSMPDFFQEMTGDPRLFYKPETDQRDRDAHGYTSNPGSWQDLAEAWRFSDLHEALGTTLWRDFPAAIARTKAEGGVGLEEPKKVVAPAMLQYKTLMKRQLLTVLRNPQFSYARVAQIIMFSVIISLTWFDQGTDATTDVLPRFGSLLVNCIVVIFLVYPNMPFFCFLRNVHAFQVNSQYYDAPMFYLAFQSIELLWVIPEIFISSIIIYAIQDLNGDPLISEKWLVNYLNIVIVRSFGTAFVIMIVGLFNGNSERAHSTFPVFLYIILVTAGFIVIKDELDYPWKAFLYINPVHYAFATSTLNEFWGLEFSGETPCSDTQIEDNFPIECEKEGDRFVQEGIPGESFLYFYDLYDEESKKWEFLFINLCFLLFWQFAALTATSALVREVFTPSILILDYDVKTHRQEEAALGIETYQSTGSVAVKKRKFRKLIPRILISWSGLNYGVDLVDRETKKPFFKHILHDVFGYAEPGKVIALMGATGAGKSTLMDVLADYKTIGKQWGEIKVNGIERTEESDIYKIFHMVSGYCEQFDSHEGSMTVRQAIEFSAHLRLPTNIPEDEIQDRVDDVLAKLELVPLQDTMIGNDHSGGISPEYRKKVTIGVELVMDPGLLFLDEPTTGLDSASALNVMTCVKGLADEMSIVCTIHQPSVEVFAVFDLMMLLKQGGKVCYFGDVEKMGDYFSDVGLGEWNGVQNIADFALDCSYAVSDSGKASDELFLEHQRYQDAIDGLAKNDDGLEEPTVDWDLRPTWAMQMKALLWRDYNRVFVAQRENTYIRIAAWGMVSTILGWLFFDTKNTQGGTNTRAATCFMSLALTGFFVQQHIPFLLGQRGYIFREKKANMYSPVPLVIARQAIEIPINLCESVLMTVPLYFMSGMNGDFFKFWFAWTTAYITNASFVEMAISLASTEEMADALSSVMNAINMIFAGFLIQEDKIPIYFKPLHYISLAHYGVFAIGLNEFEADEYDVIPPDADGTSIFSSGQQVIDYYNFDQMAYGEYLLTFLGFLTVYKTITMLVFIYVEHIKR